MYLFLGFMGLVIFRKVRMKPFKNQALSSYIMSRVFCPYMKQGFDEQPWTHRSGWLKERKVHPVLSVGREQQWDSYA